MRIVTFLVGSQEQTWLPQRARSGKLAVDVRGRAIYKAPGRPFPSRC